MCEDKHWVAVYEILTVKQLKEMENEYSILLLQ